MLFRPTLFLLLTSFISLTIPCSAGDLFSPDKDFTQPSTPEISGDENSNQQEAASFQVNPALTVVYGTHGAKGDTRSSMEDTHYPLNAHVSRLRELSPLIADGIHFFGLYDGHGGKNAAQYAQARLHNILQETECFRKGDYKNALSEAYLKTHEEYIAGAQNNDGTTAVTALFVGSELLIANAGDSEAVLYLENQKAQCITQIHSPADKNECMRIMSHHGSAVKIIRKEKIVTYQHVLKDNGKPSIYKVSTETPTKYRNALTYNFLDTYSLGGDETYIEKFHTVGKIIRKDTFYLAVSRGLGDKKYLPFVTPTPFVQSLKLDQPGFLILGCDGLWDVMSYQAAVNFVLRDMNLKNLTLQRLTHDDAEQIAEHLVSKALEICDHDNVTVSLIFFTPNL